MLSVKNLNLANNNLTHLPLALTELSSLHSLNLIGNPLVSLNGQVLANISHSLTSLYISVDKFSRFPNELGMLSSLTHLTMKGIKFPMFHSTIFRSFQNSLVYLDMPQAYFESIPAAVCRLKVLKIFPPVLVDKITLFSMSATKD